MSKTHFNQKDSTGVNKYNDISMYTFFTCIATDVNFSNYIPCILSLCNKKYTLSTHCLKESCKPGTIV